MVNPGLNLSLNELRLIIGEDRNISDYENKSAKDQDQGLELKIIS